MADFYLDEDVGQVLATGLRQFGHSSVRTVSEGRSGATDADQLAYAATNQLILVTHNQNDFRNLHAIWQQWRSIGLPSHYGVLNVPQPRSRFNMHYGYSYAVAAQLIDALLAAQSLENAFLQWHPIHGWTS